MKTILVVDDEPTFRLLLKNALQDTGYDILQAGDGEEALETLRKTAVDLVISDIYMPLMDGFKLHKAIRGSSQWEKLPILFISAYDDEHTIDVIRNPKIEGFIRKGIAIEEILAWVDYLIAPDEKKRAKLPPTRLGKRQHTG